MIYAVNKLDDGWFLINGEVKVQYIEENDDITMNLEFNEETITETEAVELGNELLRETLNHFIENTEK